MGKYFGTSQNKIEDKQTGTEGVLILNYNGKFNLGICLYLFIYF